MLVRVNGKRRNSVVKALIRQAGRLPEGMMPSLTWSRNDEQATHKRFVIATEADAVYGIGAVPGSAPTVKMRTAYSANIFRRDAVSL